QMRQIGGQAAYLSQDMLDVHFGLGDFEVADLEVTWPDGMVSEHRQIPAGSSVRIVRPEAGDPVVTW
ncbi:MAG: ASPIC/UnbV domain-containing protein, partial [Phycisphaerales bacterium]|nr:ASPIC/UnbV domain-containing protein [Phycisphaerales bacterium]